jgi:hypothetical protein
MELDEFVCKTLEQVISGVKKSHEHAKSLGSRIAMKGFSHIEFDVAVTVTEGSESKKGGGITVWGVAGNAEGKSATTNSSVSRIKFSVPVCLPRSHPETGGGGYGAAG